MPKVTLTYRDKVDAKIQKMMVQCLGIKAFKKISWEKIADEMFMPRSTVAYRFKNGLLTLSEWMILWHILGMTQEDIDIFF